MTQTVLISDKPEDTMPCRTPGNSSPGRNNATPYWSDFTDSLSPHLWLPTLNGQETLNSAQYNGLPDKTSSGSWFSTTQLTAPIDHADRIFTPASTATLSLEDLTACLNAKTQSTRIRVYPTKEQTKILRLWFDAARWCYNETVAQLNLTGEDANWKTIKARTIKARIINAIPQRLKDVPYQVKSIAVRDACRAISQAKLKNLLLKEDKTPGLRLDQHYHEVKFRSRKAPKQGCFIPKKAVKQSGIYQKKLGKLLLSETLPINHRDSRLTLHNGQYHLAVPKPAERRQDETQARVVALDPGIRSFLTWFSESNTGHIAPRAFGKIQRLCAHLDDLLSRAKLEKKRLAKRNKYRAADRLRARIRNLIDELHHQAARWLVDNFDVILLPTFETQDMTKRGARKLRSKSVRSLLNYAHYRFRQFLAWKAWQARTCCWSTRPTLARPAAGAARSSLTWADAGSWPAPMASASTAPAGYSCGLWEIHLPYAKSRRSTSATALPALVAFVSEEVSASIYHTNQVSQSLTRVTLLHSYNTICLHLQHSSALPCPSIPTQKSPPAPRRTFRP